jgi:hypothetical protein
MANHLPYTLEELFGGAVRPVFAPITVAVPANLDDVHALISPYGLKTGWLGLGATTGPAVYGRNLSTSGFSIQQESSNVLEVPNETIRTIQLPLGEIRKEVLEIIEQSPGSGATTAGVGKSVQDKTPVGSINDLTQYRVAFIGRRQKSQGVVQEGAGTGMPVRGRFLAFAGYRCQIEAENVQMSFDRTALASATVTFKLFPEPTITAEGTEHGVWLSERAGIIATA